MRIIGSVLVFLLCSLTSISQVKFFEGTFEEALVKGGTEGKPILFLVTSAEG